MNGSYGRRQETYFALGAPDTYPNKYLRSGWQQRLAGRRLGAERAATIPLSLLFPILVLLMLSVTLQQDDGRGNFDPQLAVRVAGYSLAALSVLLALVRRRLHAEPWIVAWALVPIFVTLTALYGPEPYFSLTAGLAHLALLLFAWRMVNRHGPARTVLTIVIAGTIVGALSIFVFFAFPDFGRSAMDTLSGDPGGRMRGVTAQPNSLGSVSAISVLLAVMYFRAFTARQRVLAIAAIAIGAFCIVYSDSRTSIAVLLLCLLLWRVCRANAAFNLFAVVAIALVASLIITFVPDVSAYLSRNGAGSAELASLNGRSRIWEVAWESIQAHPMLGQGYGSSRLLLPIDDRLFGAAINTHNVYLELLFSGGAVLLALFAVAVTVAIFRSARQGRAEALIVLLFFLVRGAAEAAPYAGLPLLPTFVFYAAVSLCLARSTPRVQSDRRIKLVPMPT